MNSLEERVGFMYAGLPGAGKTTAARIGASYTGGTYLETGDIVRRAAEEDGVDVNDSEALGNYAAEKRAELGNGFVSQQLVGRFLRGEEEIEYPIHVSGVRHIEGANELRAFLYKSGLLVLETPFEVRLERLRQRSREGEEEFQDIDLLERDRRELNELGTETILSSNEVDGKIINDKDIHFLEERMKEFIDSYGTYE